jgi:hypothetical protein
MALLGAEVWLVGAVGTRHARALELVVAWLARQTRVASAANVREIILDLGVVISSIEAEELPQALEVLHKGGAGGACS